MNSTNKNLSIFVVVLMIFTLGLLYNTTTITSFLTNTKFDADDNNSVNTSATNTSSKSSGILVVVTGVAVVALVACILSRKSNDTKTSSNELKLNKSKDLDDKKFKAFVPNKTKQEFLDDRINDLIDIQNCRMNIDYDGLKNKVSESLFTEYNSELSYLQKNNERNIMKDFKALDSMITSADVVNGHYEIRVEVIMQYIDYIEKDGVRISGDEYLPNIKLYELVFTSPLRSTQDICPNCGTSIVDKTSKVCPSCNTSLVKDNKWVLSKKIIKGRK